MRCHGVFKDTQQSTFYSWCLPSFLRNPVVRGRNLTVLGIKDIGTAPPGLAGGSNSRMDKFMKEAGNYATRQKLLIVGNVGASTFVPWIERHAHKLGLTGCVCRESARCVEVEAEGCEDMLDAMEVGCLLGPAEVWVESVSRVRLTNR